MGDERVGRGAQQGLRGLHGLAPNAQKLRRLALSGLTLSGLGLKSLGLSGLGLSALALSGMVLPGDAVAEAADSRSAADALVDGSSADGLRVWANDGLSASLRVGDLVVYRFVSDRAAYLTVLHIDSKGLGTLLLPGPNAREAHVDSGVERVFPGPELGEQLEVQLPIGSETLLVVATLEPLPRTRLGIAPNAGPVAILKPSEVSDLIARLQQTVVSTGTARVARLVQRVLARDDKTLYRAAEIVDYFTTRTRSISRPRLDLHIHFATGSATLNADARRNLDEVAAALTAFELIDERFVVGGHTDDRGSDALNMDLSERRSRSVIEYLVQQAGVAADRLDSEGYGEGAPLEAGRDEWSRKMNRRVEFQLVR